MANQVKAAVSSLMSAAAALPVGEALSISTTEVQIKIQALDPAAVLTSGTTLGRSHAHVLSADGHGAERRAHTLSIAGQVPPGALPASGATSVVSGVSVWKPINGVAAAAFVENGTAQAADGKIEVAKPMGDVIQPRFQVDGVEVTDLDQDMDIETVVVEGAAHRRAQGLAELLSAACGDAAAIQGGVQPHGVDGANCNAHLELRWWDEVEMKWRGLDGVQVDPDSGTIKGKTKKVAPLVGFVVSVLPVLNAPDPSLLATMTWPEAAALSPIWGMYVLYLILLTIGYFWDERAREKLEEKKKRAAAKAVEPILRQDEAPQTCRSLCTWWQEITRDLRTHNWFSWFFCPPTAPYNRMRRITVLASLWFTVQLFTALLFGNKENSQGVRQFTTPIFTAVCLMPTTVSMSLIFKRARPRLGGLFGTPHTAVDKKTSANDEIREAFEWCDEDGSGELVEDELVGVLMRLGCDRETALRESREIMEMADTDRSGRLDVEEFANAVLNPTDPTKATAFRSLVLNKGARGPRPAGDDPATAPDRREDSPRALLDAAGDDTGAHVRRTPDRSDAPLQDVIAAIDYAAARTRRVSIGRPLEPDCTECPVCRAAVPRTGGSNVCPVCNAEWEDQVMTGVVAPTPTPQRAHPGPLSPTEPFATSPLQSGSPSEACLMSHDDAAGMVSPSSDSRLLSTTTAAGAGDIDDPYLSVPSCRAASGGAVGGPRSPDADPDCGRDPYGCPDSARDLAVGEGGQSSSESEGLEPVGRRPSQQRKQPHQSAIHLNWWQALVFNTTRTVRSGAGARYCLGMRWGVTGDQIPTPLRTIIRKADPLALQQITAGAKPRGPGAGAGSQRQQKRGLPLPVLARAAQELRSRVDDAGVPLAASAARPATSADGVPVGAAAMADIVHSRRIMLAAILRDCMRRRVVALTMLGRKGAGSRPSASFGKSRRVSAIPHGDTHNHTPGCPGQGIGATGYSSCPLCGGQPIPGAEPPSDATLRDGTVATGQAGRLLLEAAALERDWAMGRIFNSWMRRVLARTGLVHCTLVSALTGRCYDVGLHPLLQVGVVAESFALHAVRSDVGLTRKDQRFRCEHRGLYVALTDLVADVVIHGQRSDNGRYKIRISFHDDTMTEVDSDLDVRGADDVQEFFRVDPESLGGTLRLLPPEQPPWYIRVWQRVRGRWRAALIVSAIVAFFYLANNWPCPCNVGVIIGAWAVLMGLLYCDAPVESLVIIALGLVLGFLALYVFLVANKTFGAFLMLTWLFAVVAVCMSELQHRKPKYKPWTKPVVPYVLGTYWLTLCFYFTRIEYGAPWYATLLCMSCLPPLFWFCRYKVQRDWGRKYLAMLLFVTGAVLALAISMLAIPWSRSDWSERRERTGPPERFEAIVLVVTLWVFGAGLTFAVFKLNGLDMIPEQLSPTWAMTTFVVAMVGHWAAIFMIMSLALEFHREGRLRIYYNAIITAYVQDILFNEPLKVLFLTQFGPVMKTLMKVGAGKVIRYVLVETGIFELWMRLLS